MILLKVSPVVHVHVHALSTDLCYHPIALGYKWIRLGQAGLIGMSQLMAHNIVNNTQEHKTIQVRIGLLPKVYPAALLTEVKDTNTNSV